MQLDWQQIESGEYSSLRNTACILSVPPPTLYLPSLVSHSLPHPCYFWMNGSMETCSQRTGTAAVKLGIYKPSQYQHSQWCHVRHSQRLLQECHVCVCVCDFVFLGAWVMVVGGRGKGRLVRPLTCTCTHAIHRQLATGQGRLLRRRGSWINNQAVEGSYSCLLACFLSSVLV